MVLAPGAEFPNENFFKKLCLFKEFILTGDLNCKSRTWYCRSNNPNGKKLEEILQKFRITIVWNKHYTHYSAAHNSFDITDIIIASPNLLEKLSNLKVFKAALPSDLFPIVFQLNITNTYKIENKKSITRLDIKKCINTAEERFKYFFDKNLQRHLSTHDTDNTNFVFNKVIENAQNMATVKYTKKL